MTVSWRTPAGPPQSLTTTTGYGGEYRFVDLQPGRYTVQTQPFNSLTHRFSPADQGGDDSKDSDFRPVPCAPAHEGKDVIGSADTTVSGGTASDLDGGVYPVM
jgi:hypothetical protein